MKRQETGTKTRVLFTDIKETIYVRTKLDEHRVFHLAQLIETGVELDRMVISKDLDLIDGRHRKAAYELLDFKGEIEVEMRNYVSRADMIVAALAANTDGALPPTQSDIDHTIEALFATGATRKDIIALMTKRTSFPAKLVQRYLDQVQGNLAKARLREAVNDVLNNNETVANAAAAHSVDLDSLKKALSTKVTEADGEGVNTIKSVLSIATGKYVGVLARRVLNIHKDLSDAVITEADSVSVVAHLKKIQARLNRSFEGWYDRLNVKAATSGAARKVLSARAGAPAKRKADKLLAKMGLQD